jgi:hypothetical protein
MILLLQELGSVDRVAATQNNYDDDHIHGKCNGLTGGRFLGTTKYIFPGVLRADQPVCGKLVRGEPYSGSCLPPPANRPNRGCNKYYRCRM